MKILTVLIGGMTLIGSIYLITNSHGKLIFDLGKNGAKIEIDSQSHPLIEPIKNGCQPGEDDNHLCKNQ